MAHPLDDCRLKVARAKEQFNTLRDEIVEFDKANPYEISVEVDPETGDELLKCANPPAFPRRWGVLVGELAHNLRSALDYLIGALITEAGGQPKGNAFPIARSKAQYTRRSSGKLSYRDRMLRGMPEPMRKRIDAFQPYRLGRLAHADALGALGELTNKDKHNELQPAYAWINTPPSRAFAFPTDDEMADLEIRLPRNGGFSVQAQFKHNGGTPARLVMYPNVQVPRPLGIEVVFGRDPGRLAGLDDIANLILYVEAIIESFAGDFKT